MNCASSKLLTRTPRQSGQVGVITLLIMAVLMTVGLSVAANANRDVELSRQEGESTRVFDAAEAGIEQGLQKGITFNGERTQGNLPALENVNVTYTVDKLYQLETRLFEGVTVGVNVTGVTAPQGITVQWAHETACGGADQPAALLLSIFSVSGGTTSVRYTPLGSCAENNDGFVLANSGDFGPTGVYHRQFTVNLAANDVLVRIKPLYNDTHLKVIGNNWTLPVQGVKVRSEARNDDDRGQEARAVEVYRSLATAPSVMDYALVSGADIIK